MGYLDYFRAVIAQKVSGLSEAQLRQSILPSGWSPLELVKHLVNVERRWMLWGFAGLTVEDPWADERDGRWFVDSHESLEGLLGALLAGAERTRVTVMQHELDDPGEPGERWDGDDPATLERVLLHLVQEYARHAGHLDVVRELLDGSTGE